MPSDPFEADMLRMAEAIAVADQEEPDIPVLQRMYCSNVFWLVLCVLFVLD